MSICRLGQIKVFKNMELYIGVLGGVMRMTNTPLKALAVYNLQGGRGANPRHATVRGQAARGVALRNVVGTAQLVNRVNQGLYVFRRRELRNAVAKVENMARSSTERSEHLSGLFADHVG